MKIDVTMSVDLEVEVDLHDVPLASLALAVAESRDCVHWQQLQEPILALH